MSDKDFWTAVRQALLIMVSAIERRYFDRRYKHICIDGTREIHPAETVAGVAYGLQNTTD